jgi:uncharacterized protein (TIGR03067 family)
MRRYVTLALVACILISAEGKKAKPTKDAEKMKGSWTVAEAVNNGETAGEDDVKKLSVTIKDSTLTFSTGDDTYDVPIKLDPAKKPKTIDAMPAGGPFKDMKMLGIYEIKDDTLKMCYGLPGKERPKEFKSEVDSGTILLVLKRKTD